MKLHRSKTFKAVMVAGAVSLLSVTGVARAADSTSPIVIPTHNWSSQIVMAYVIGGIFENMGNNVEYVPADSQAVYESIRNGDVTISHEVWQSTFGKSFYNAMAKGELLTLAHTLQPPLKKWVFLPGLSTKVCVLVYQTGKRLRTAMPTSPRRIPMAKVVGWKARKAGMVI